MVPETAKDGYSCANCGFFISSASLFGLYPTAKLDIESQLFFGGASRVPPPDYRKEKTMGDNLVGFWEEFVALVEGASAAVEKGYITGSEARDQVRRVFPAARENDERAAKIEAVERELEELKAR